jgi:hypothetical protein
MNRDQFLLRAAALPHAPFWIASSSVFATAAAWRLIDGRRILPRFEPSLARACALAAGASLAAALSFTAVLGEPKPNVHDEYSYLLAADTFSRGRLTNPTHPMWRHFESPHIFHRPTYMSKYPPGQGLALALGKVLSGHAVAGVWLSVAAACAALCWMLAAWVPVRWALAGSLLAAVHPLVVAWSMTYRGGAVAFLGGCLLLGAWKRLRQRPEPVQGAVFGIALALLANSRPFEGFVFCLPLGLMLLADWRRNARALAACAAVVAAAAAWMLYYNWRITGDPLLMPYMLHEQAYSLYPTFVWQDPRPEPKFSYALLRSFHVDWEFGHFLSLRSPFGFIRGTAYKLWVLAEAYLGAPLLVLPLWALLSRAARDKEAAALAAYGALFVAATMAAVWSNPEYVGPAVGLFFLLVTLGLRRLDAFRLRAVLLGSALSMFLFPRNIILFSTGTSRPRLEASLTEKGGNHLVAVSYGPNQYTHDEWVYNGADIDSQRVVWAHSLSAAQDQELALYFKDREARHLLVEVTTPERGSER